MDASVFCTDVGVLLGLAEVHSDRVHGAGQPWGGAEARSKILRVWVGSGVLEGGSYEGRGCDGMNQYQDGERQE